jgi:hypothetical protein
MITSIIKDPNIDHFKIAKFPFVTEIVVQPASRFSENGVKWAVAISFTFTHLASPARAHAHVRPRAACNFWFGFGVATRFGPHFVRASPVTHCTNYSPRARVCACVGLHARMKPPNRDSPFWANLEVVGTEIVVRNLPKEPKSRLSEFDPSMGILRNSAVSMGILRYWAVAMGILRSE